MWLRIAAQEGGRSCEPVFACPRCWCLAARPRPRENHDHGSGGTTGTVMPSPIRIPAPASTGSSGGNSGSSGGTSGSSGGTTAARGPTGTNGLPACDSGLPDVNGCPCDAEGTTRACYTGPAGTEHVGACHDGQQTCTSVGEFLVWGPCTGDVTPRPKSAATTNDENCNGVVGCADSACTGIVGCCTAGTSRSCYDGPPAPAAWARASRAPRPATRTARGWRAPTKCFPRRKRATAPTASTTTATASIDCKDPACASDPACQPQICAPGSTEACYDGAAGTSGVGCATAAR